jgi:hypothetical protein
MNNPYLVSSSTLQWFKSSYSNGSGGECVECAWADEGALVRDSKRPGEGVLAVRKDAWRAFLEAVGRAGIGSEPGTGS